MYSGPLYKDMETNNNEVTLHFDHTGRGLLIKGDQLRGFTVAGKDRKFYQADAEISGDRVIVSSEAVRNPAAVRYSWANNPDGNLYNKSGLPASPFRTDDWPGITAEKP